MPLEANNKEQVEFKKSMPLLDLIATTLA